MTQSGAPTGSAARPVLKDLLQVGAACLPDWNQPEEQSCDDSKCGRKDQEPTIQTCLRRAWEAASSEGNNQRHDDASKQDADCTACERQDQAFGDGLANESPTSGAQRSSQGHFFLPDRRTREQEIGYVR